MKKVLVCLLVGLLVFVSIHRKELKFLESETVPQSLLDYKVGICDTVFNYSDLKITHAFARFYNFGDNALAYGVKNIFFKYFSPNIRFINEDVHTTIFNQSKLDSINKISDLFIVGGGGLLHTFDSEYWLFNLPNENVKDLRIPLLVFGLGYNNFSSIPLHPEAVKNVEKIKNKSVSFTVRNDGSKERLANLGLNFEEIPDPGFFVDGNHPKPNIKGEYVILQLANDDTTNRKISDKFKSNIISVVKILIKKGYIVILTPHCYPDISISKTVIDRIASQKCIMWDWHKIMREDSVNIGLGYYKYAKFVIAMRGHGQICSIGMLVPVVSIINHPKHIGLLKKLGLENMSVKVDELNFVENITNIIEYVETNREKIRNHYSKIMKDFSKSMENYMNGIKQKLERRK